MEDIKIYNTSIRQYSKWTRTLTFTNLDLTNYSAKMQIRSIKDNSLLVELTTDNDRIVIDVATSTITLVIPTSVTSNLSHSTGNPYDFLLIDGEGEGYPIFKGTIDVIEGVTEL